MKTTLFGICVVNLISVAIAAELVSNCFECAKMGQDFFQCSNTNSLKYEVTCCEKGDVDAMCVASSTRTCS